MRMISLDSSSRPNISEIIEFLKREISSIKDSLQSVNANVNLNSQFFESQIYIFPSKLEVQSLNFKLKGFQKPILSSFNFELKEFKLSFEEANDSEARYKVSIMKGNDLQIHAFIRSKEDFEKLKQIK